MNKTVLDEKAKSESTIRIEMDAMKDVYNAIRDLKKDDALRICKAALILHGALDTEIPR